MIKAEELTKYYGQKCALDHVSFEIKKGEVVGLLGPNAAGKTTTMRILTGYFPPTSGKATVAGFDMSSDPLSARKKTGYLPESVPLYMDMTVEEFLFFAAEAKGLKGGAIKERVKKVIEECNLPEYASKQIKTLSKGYKQRTGLAQAIIASPEVLILDEPTVGMDPNQVIEIRDIIRRLSENSTIILSSHILEEIAKTCSRIIIMNRGKILATGSPEKLSEQMEKSDKIYFELKGDKDKATGIISSEKGISSCRITEDEKADNGSFGIEAISEKSPEIRNRIIKALAEADIDIYQMKLEKMNLEQIFTEIVKKGGTEKK